MRFTRYPKSDRPESRTVSPQRLAAAKKAVQKDKDSWALFPENVKHQTAEERISAWNVGAFEFWQDQRAHVAATWRRARARLRKLPALKRAGLIRYWQTVWTGPRACEYLAGMVGDGERGVCFWHKMADHRRLVLIGQGRMVAPWKKG